MEDYPKTLAEFEERFGTEDACREYLFQLRWPEGFVCPRCQGDQSWLTERGQLVCSVCGYHASVTAGTIFQGTHKPLKTWFRAIWWITSQKTGTSHCHLDYYLDEFTFRFNRRTSRYRGKLFYRLVQQAANVDPVLYSAMVKHVRGRNAKRSMI